MAERITDALARSITPPARTNRIVYDTDIKGFGLRVTRAGAKSFVLNYRAAGRERRITIGQYPDWSVAAARNEAKSLKREVDRGFDPMEERHTERAAPTVADLVHRYLDEYAIAKAPRSQKDDRSMLEKLVLPSIGRMKVNSVTHDHIDQLHREISIDRPVRANRMAQCLSKVFNLGIRWGYRSDNPVAGVRKNHEDVRRRYLSADELRRLIVVLDAHTNKVAANLIRFLLLTGARRGEAMNATWDQFDLTAGIWTKPSAHTKQRREHRIPISAATIELLHSIKRGSHERHVFPGSIPGEPIKEIKRFWDGVRRDTGLGDFRIHDLRHTYASLLASSGHSLPIIGALLGHTQVQTTARYAHLFDDPLRAATDQVSAVLRAASASSAPGGTNK